MTPHPRIFACYAVAAAFPEGGGVGRRVSRICGSIRRLSLGEVTCLRSARDFPESVQRDGQGLFRYSTQENWHHVVVRLARSVPEDVNVLFLNGDPLEYDVACVLRRWRGIRCVSVVCGDSPHYHNVALTYRDLIDVHVALTHATAERIRGLLGAPADVRVIHTGVELPALLPGESTSSPGRYGVPLRLIYVGRIAQALKSVFRLADVASGLQEAGVPFEMTIVGDGPEKPALQAAVLKRGLGEAVRFTGHLDSDGVSRELRKASVFLLTSVTEGLSNALLEAMAHGCVPVAMAIPGIDDVIADGENGCVVPQGDCLAMAARLADLSRTPAEISRMAAMARTTIARDFTVDRMAYRYAEVFGELAALGPFTGPVPVVRSQRSRLDHPCIPSWLTIALRRFRKALRP